MKCDCKSLLALSTSFVIVCLRMPELGELNINKVNVVFVYLIPNETKKIIKGL